MSIRAKPRWHAGKGRWYASVGDITIVGGKARRKQVLAPATIGRDDERAAWRWLESLTESARPVHPSQLPEAETVASLVDRYVEALAAKVTAKHVRNKRLHLDALIVHVGGDTPAAQVTAEKLTQLIDGMRRAGMSAHYRRNVAASIKSLFRWGGLESVATGLARPAAPKAPARFAQRGEAAVWLWWLWRQRDRGQLRFRWHRNAVLLHRCLIRTGARPHELARARWAHVRWRGWEDRAGHWCAKIVLPPEVWKVGERTGRERTIYLTAALSRALRRHQRDGHGGDVHVFVHGPGARGEGREQPWQDGTTLAQAVRRWRGAMIEDRAAAVKQAKRGKPPLSALQRALVAIEIRESGPDRLTNYRWRHTAISTLVMAGVDLPTIAELCGTSVEVIQHTYAHLLDSHLARAANALAYR